MSHHSDQPKPTEWTVDDLKNIWHGQICIGQNPHRIADAHNATLVTESVRSIESMTRVQQQVNDQAKEIQQLRVQLAAEREKLEARHKLCVDYETKWKAEKEKSRILGNMIDGLPGIPGLRENLKLHQEEFDRLAKIIEADTLENEQLREKVRTLVDAAKRREELGFLSRETK